MKRLVTAALAISLLCAGSWLLANISPVIAQVVAAYIILGLGIMAGLKAVFDE